VLRSTSAGDILGGILGAISGHSLWDHSGIILSKLKAMQLWDILGPSWVNLGHRHQPCIVSKKDVAIVRQQSLSVGTCHLQRMSSLSPQYKQLRASVVTLPEPLAAMSASQRCKSSPFTYRIVATTEYNICVCSLVIGEV
jgi:hypothetical protein